jgi:hypothetical protein
MFLVLMAVHDILRGFRVWDGVAVAVGAIYSAIAAKAYAFFYEGSESGVNWRVAGFTLAGGIATVLITKLAERYVQRKQLGDAEETRRDANRLSYDEKVADMAQTGWQTYLSELKTFHEKQLTTVTANYKQQIEFLQAQILTLEIDSYRDRLVKHNAFDEVQRLHARIKTIEVAYAKCTERLTNLGDKGDEKLPDFQLKYQDDIVAGVDAAVDLYKRSLRKNAQAVAGDPAATDTTTG